MKTILLLSALALSLAANAWFAFFRAPSPRAGFTAADASTSSSAKSASRSSGGANAGTRSSGAPALATPYVWKDISPSNTDLRALAADLRAAGFPPEVTVRFVGEMLRDRAYAEVAKLPFWQLRAPSLETRKMQSDAARELLRLQEEILGPSGSQVATLDPTERRQQYGSLSDDKVAALLRIDRDYNELRGGIVVGGDATTMEEARARQEQQRTLEKERLADIAAALSPEEYADWERRSSGAANRVMNSLHNLTVTEEEYTALLAAQKVRDPVSATSAFVNLDDSLGKRTEVYAYMEKVRATLGEERAVSYLKSSDFFYAQVASFAEKNPAVTPVKTFELYKLQNEAQVLAAQMRQGGESADGPRAPSEQMRKSLADLNARLDALLGADTAEAYRSQGMGAVFRAFSPRPPAGAVPPPKG